MNTQNTQGVQQLKPQQYFSLVPDSYTGDKGVYLNLVKEKLVGQNLKLEHMGLFLYTAKRTGLDPLANQIYAVARFNSKKNAYDMTIQTGIDGFRVVAQRGGAYAGQDDAVFTVEELFNPVSSQVEKDLKASVTVYRVVDSVRLPVTASARWRQYVQLDKEGKPTGLWAKMPHVMLAKVAEALALRKAFPNDLSGIYTSEEMDQTDNADQVKVEDINVEEPLKHEGDNQPAANGTVIVN